MAEESNRVLLAGDIGGTRTRHVSYERAGNLALTVLATGGVYLGGGIVPRIVDRLRQGRFMEAFIAKGRISSVLERIPVFAILNDRAALLGAGRHTAEQLGLPPTRASERDRELR